MSGQALGKLGIEHDKSVLVELELPDKASVLADVAHDEAVITPADVLIALAGRVQSEVWHRHPGHKEVHLSGAKVKLVPTDGHDVRQRAASEIAIERASHCGDFPTRRGQADSTLFRGLHCPVSAAVMAQVELTRPARAGGRDTQATGDPFGVDPKLVVEAIGKWLDADLSAGGLQGVGLRLDRGRLGAPGVESAPDQLPAHRRGL